MGKQVGLPYVWGCDTSEAAADSMVGIVSGLRALVLRYVHRQRDEGATCDEIELALSMRHQTASARVRELVQLGALVDSGRRRATRSGRSARVYVVRP